MSSILNIGKSALAAAQVGINTAGHNIANASTPGYSRQMVIHATAPSQNFGFGFMGQGTQIASITRVYNTVLAGQAAKSQSTAASLETYNAEMASINNMLSDPEAGLNPAMNDFFASVQDLSANPSDIATRQSMLSYAQSLANRFQSTNNRLNEIRDGINNQLTSSINLVNNYAKQIASLNDSIEKSVSADGNIPNDLMDQRDQLVLELSKQIKTTVVPQGLGSYNIFIGNGLPMVVGNDTFSLVAGASPTDPTRVEAAYQSNGKTTILGINSITGGVMGGLVQFRAESLDATQNQVGQMAAVLAETYNTQHKLGFDLNGDLGGALFNIPSPAVNANADNTGSGVVTSTIVNARALTTSDYRIKFDGTNYTITRLSDQTSQSFASLPKTIDGISFNISAGAAAGDSYEIQPTRNVADGIKIAITDVNKLAIGGPALSTSASTSNTGSASIISNGYVANPAATAFTITYNAGAPGTLTGFIATQPVTVTDSTGLTTIYAAGAPVTFSNGAFISTAGLSFMLSGTPNNGDQFSITPNSTSSGPGDNRNGLLLAGLQSAKTLNGSKTSYSDAFGQMVNGVGNKTRELSVLASAETQVLTQINAAMQSTSGVNLDEEATDLIRYQQAYQAAGKVMQIASQLFDTLLQLGN